MPAQRGRWRRPAYRGTGGTAVVAVFVAVALTACGGAARSVTSTTRRTTPPTSAPTTTVPTSATPVSLYFVRGTVLGVAHRELPSPTDARNLTVQALLAGPTPAESASGLGTQIAPDTALRGLEVRGGLATVNLSPQFVTPGPRAVLSARLAQVVYTLTSFANIDRVAIEVAKAPLTSFAGVDLSSPVGRAQVTAALPALLLEQPAVGDRLSGSLQVSGLTSVDGTYEIQLVDPSGRLLASTTNSAVAGGTFSQSLPLSVPAPVNGTLEVFFRPSDSALAPEQFTIDLPVGP